jgi:hypothetical protein
MDCSKCGTQNADDISFCSKCGNNLKSDYDEKLLKWLDIQSKRLELHGNKIWEEMRHFSWVLYILLGAPFVLQNNLNNSWLLIIFPLLAIFVAIIASLSVCKESKDFLDALETVLRIEKRLGFHEIEEKKTPKMLVSEGRMKKLNFEKDVTIDKFIEKNQSIICKLTSKLTSLPNRSLFVVYFIGLILIGIVELICLIFFILQL